MEEDRDNAEIGSDDVEKVYVVDEELDRCCEDDEELMKLELEFLELVGTTSNQYQGK